MANRHKSLFPSFKKKSFLDSMFLFSCHLNESFPLLPHSKLFSGSLTSNFNPTSLKLTITSEFLNPIKLKFHFTFFFFFFWYSLHFETLGISDITLLNLCLPSCLGFPFANSSSLRPLIVVSLLGFVLSLLYLLQIIK